MDQTMDETYTFNADDDVEKLQSSSQWQMEHNTSYLDKESSQLLLQYQNYHLHLIQKKEIPSTRRKIPATKFERLSFYRNYVSCRNKSQIMVSNQYGFFWTYLFSMLFKSLPYTYINIFLASYVPEEHFFIQKMSPLFKGSKFVIILSSIFQLVFFSESIPWLLDYIVQGFVHKNPWNRCPAYGFYYEAYKTRNVTVNCYSIPDIVEKFNKNVIIDFSNLAYLSKDGEYFQFAQIEYLINRYEKMSIMAFSIYFVLIWILTSFCSNLIFSKPFWKVFNITQLMITAVDVLVFLHTVFTSIEMSENPERAQNMTPKKNMPAILYHDIEVLLESTIAPPIVHFLTARSLQEIIPTRDSAMIITSNTMFYIFRSFMIYRLVRQCEYKMNIQVFPTNTSFLNWFYMWTMYLSSFFFGDILTLLLFLLTLIPEFCTFVVLYHVLIEVIVSEWNYLSRLVVIPVVTVFGILIYYSFQINTLVYMSVLSKLLVNLIEWVVLYFMYPLSRLIDDMTFHYGTLPTKLRIVSFKLAFLVFLAIFISSLFILIVYINDTPGKYRKYFLLSLIPLILLFGAVYAAVQYNRRKKSFKRLLIPEDTWGPKDYNIRQLRKDYDSRFYIGSQAPRNLSRYLMMKSESETYRLDLNYDPRRRSTVIRTSEYKNK